MYQLTQFGIYTLPNYDTVSDIGSGDTRMRLHDLPEGGAYDDQSAIEHATAGAQLITKACTAYYESESDMLTNMRLLREYAGVQQTLYRTALATGDIEWCKARCKKIDMVRKSGNKFTLDMTFHFLRLSPVWYGDAHAEQRDLTGGGVTNDLIFANNGNAYIDNAIITITAGTGTITQVIARHTTVGGTIYNDLVWNGSLSTAQVLEIDCGAFTVKKNGVDDYANFSLGAGHREVPWFRLWAEANNYVKVILTGGTGTEPATIDLDYYDGWK
jgi:hypothetical protein